MNQCKDCRYWGARLMHGYVPKDVSLARCGKVRMLFNSWHFDKDTQKHVIDDDAQGVLAFAADASDYIAQLLTLPEFGCVMFKPKESGK